MKKIKKTACLVLASTFLCTSMVTSHVQAMGAAGSIASGNGTPYCSDSGAFSLLLQLFGVEYDSTKASEQRGLYKDIFEYTPEELQEMYDNGEFDFVSPEEVFWDDANKCMAKFLDFAQEKINGAQFQTNMEAVKEWLHDVACGALDKASDVFKLLKMFIANMKSPSASAEGNSVVDSKGYTGYLQGFTFNTYFNGGSTYSLELRHAEAPVYVSCDDHLRSGDGKYVVYGFCFVSVKPFRVGKHSSEKVKVYGEEFQMVNFATALLNTFDGRNYESVGYDLSWDELYLQIRDVTYNDNTDDSPFIITPPLDNVIGRDNSLDNVDVVGVGSKAGATDIPLNLDDLMERVGSIEGMVTALKEGLLTGDDVRDIVGALPVDLVNKTTIAEDEDRVIPVTDIPTAPTVDTTPAEGYTLSLKSLFPFCLPFDLIDFISVLSAPAEAPHFKWPIKYKAGNQWKEYTIDLDLGKFDTVASLLRDMECLAFIVGLIMVTRSHMIRG